MKYSELLNLWMTEKQYYTLKHRTYLRYNELIKTQILPQLGDLEISNLTVQSVRDFQSKKFIDGNTVTGRPLANNTVKNIMSIIQNSLIYGRESLNLQMFNPEELTPPTFEEKPVQVFERSEQEQIEKTVLSGRPNHFGIILCLYTGLRLGELLALTWNDIDLSAGILSVDKTSCFLTENGKYQCYVSRPKTQSSIRIIPLSKGLISELKRIKKTSKSEFVISTRNGGHVSNRSYQTTYARILKKAKVRYRNFHVLRHTFATRALECGADIKTVSEVLGHKSPVITMNRYVHSMLDTKRKMVESITKELFFGKTKKCAI